RTVAIKILPAHLSHDLEAKERFDREARAISSLSHPNICHLYDVGDDMGVIPKNSLQIRLFKRFERLIRNVVSCALRLLFQQRYPVLDDCERGLR
ncbi:MAG: hypothetical protein WAK30_11095, partial [Candidatus Acidiferrales bacterium]